MKSIFLVLSLLTAMSAFANVEVVCTPNARNAEEAIEMLNVLILPDLKDVKSVSAVTIIQGTVRSDNVKACVTVVRY